MTKFIVKLNEVNVAILNGRPIRFIPTVELYGYGEIGQWHGWSYRVYKTKTNKLIAGIVNWSAVDGETDSLEIFVAKNEGDLYNQLNNSEMYGPRLALAGELARDFEVVPTI